MPEEFAGRELWILGAIGLGFVAVLAFARKRERDRTAAIEAVAMRLGMTFEAKDQDIRKESFAGFPIFKRGSSRRFLNVTRSENLWAFDFRYTTGRGGETSTHTQTVAAVRIDAATLPSFRLEPKGLFGRIAAAFGGRDIDFADDPDFSRGYRLRGVDEDALRRVFHPVLRRHLADEKDLCIEGGGEWLAIFRHSKRVPPDELGAFTERARRLADVTSAR